MPPIDNLSGPDLLLSIINKGLAAHAELHALARRERQLDYIANDAVCFSLYSSLF